MVGAILRHGLPAGLLAFCVADTHFHALFVGDRERIGEAMRRIEIASHRMLPLEQRYEGARIRPVRDQSHLRYSVGYVLRQLDRHELKNDRLAVSSSVHDLLGLRVPGVVLASRLDAELPRGLGVELWSLLGASSELGRIWDRPVDLQDLDRLEEATLRAFSLRTLERRSRKFTRVRAALVQSVDPVVGPTAIARATGLSRGAVINLRKVTVPEHWKLAVRRQVWLSRYAGRSLAGGPAELPPWADRLSDQQAG